MPDPLRDLRALVETLPVPSAPPTYTQREAALGLALLDLSLRLEHVPRVAEHLTLIDRGHMTRSVSVDVDLHAITDAQRRRIAAPTEPGRHGTSLWIPVSRYSRSDLAPVVVKDSTGEVVPRFTHRDSDRVTAAAFVRLLAMLIDAHRDVTIRDTVVHKLRHTHQRSRWLVEAALAELVTAGSLPEAGVRTPLDYARPLPPSPGGGREADARAVRDLALAGLEELWPADGRNGIRLPFAHLLSLACSQYMLIVLLDAAQPRRFLMWDAPLLPGRRPRAPLQRIAQSVLPVNREFVVEYETAIPRSVGAYHLTVEVNEEVSVRRFVLSSDVDDDFVRALTEDVEMLAEANAGQAPHRKLLELELQGIASRLAEIGRRRLTDLTSYRHYVAERRAALPGAQPRSMSGDEVVAALGRGDCSVPVLAAFAAHYAADGMRHLARGPLAGAALPALAAGIRDYQLGHDITTDNDPREHGAHAHWRRPSVDLSPHSTQPVRAVAYLSLADEAPALIESITRMVAGLALVVLGIGTLLTGGLAWLWSAAITPHSVPEQADAVVAVLLLVPGLLIARLDLPGTNSVLGQLRQFQRSLAIASVAVTTGLAIAAGAVHTDRGITRAFQLGIAVLGLILLCCLVEFVARRARRRSPVPRSARLPRWLRGTQRRAYAPDAVFDARGEV
ncbi:hypothetical protein [Asanoa iriomotensis]|uniref:hypothetical protein n=1 Tax=Asanoa iriomotensis TaxID=234613 RepID=UPI001942D2B0|nr:hypothetical protein [Asanoa iriomotensis]